MSAHGGGMSEYVKKGIIRRHLVNLEMKIFESISSEITVKDIKWFIVGIQKFKL